MSTHLPVNPWNNEEPTRAEVDLERALRILERTLRFIEPEPLTDEARIARQMVIRAAAPLDWESRARTAEMRARDLQAAIDRALLYLDQGNPHMAAITLEERGRST